MENIDALKDEVAAAINSVSDLTELEEIRIAELGKNGRITGLMRTLGQMKATERKEAGQRFNTLKARVAELIEIRKLVLENADIDSRLTEETIDITLPVRPEIQG